MGLLDTLRNLPEQSLEGSGTHFIDADTLADDKDPSIRYRLQGIDAAEVDKVVGTGEDQHFKEGTAGGYGTTEVVHKLANSQGFTNITPQLDGQGNPVTDLYGRQIADLTDENGQSFSNRMLGGWCLWTSTDLQQTNKLPTET